MLDLDRDHLCRHLFVQELDNAAKLAWYLVRHEDQPDSSGLQVGRRLTPVILDIDIRSEDGSKLSVGVKAFALQPGLKRAAQRLDWPEDDRVCRVVDQLPHYLAADSGVGTPLHFDKRWNRILVEKKVVK